MEGSSIEDSSSWMIRAAELFPKEETQKEDSHLQIPLTELPGESVKYLGKTDNGILALSNYRIYLSNTFKHFETSIPLRVVESVVIKEMFTLIINCKDAVTYTCSFLLSESCTEWHSRITLAISVPEQLENLFGFAFHAYVSESQFTSLDQEWFNRLQHVTDIDECFHRDLERMKFDLKGAWRISFINNEFKLCPSYPKLLIVPACISDETLMSVSSFRSSRRIPAVVYRHLENGAIISRSSQPEVGWLGWRSKTDEQLLKALSDACSFDCGQERSPNVDLLGSDSLENSQCENVEMEKPKKILIVDARSYASAVTNRARGGGVECAEYYPSAEIQFMNLANIHVIRKSFQSLRQLCALEIDTPNWYTLLEKTNWIQHISGLISASNIVVHAIVEKKRSVLVHCSDGWDRTSQICSTAEICLDPFYRTIEGFTVLVEKEWLNFGHKFGDRCGHGVGSDDTNERCPVFLQWLDCIYQIHCQYPCSFEFSTSYLIKLAQHCYSCLFGTFLCNTLKERLENSIHDRTFSIWPFLSTPIYINPLYQSNREKVLWPSHSVRSLVFWNEFYFGSFHTYSNNLRGKDFSSETYFENGLIKTRSFSDLTSQDKQLKSSTLRRLSDPSMSYDEKSSITANIFQEKTNSGFNRTTIKLNISTDITDSSNFCDTKDKSTANCKKAHHTKNDVDNFKCENECLKCSSVECNLIPTRESKTRSNDHYEFLLKDKTHKKEKERTSSNLRSYTPAILDKHLNLSDGLHHGLSQENLRLQQLVHDFKVREEALQSELQVMRLALLKTNDFQVNGNTKQSNGTTIDDVNHESNSSANSWEVLSSAEEKGAIITQWIPDSARDKCKSCEIDFWLGRRRHHCRKCLEIFCGDCSDNFAQLENVQAEVRLCALCYKSVVVEKEE